MQTDSVLQTIVRFASDKKLVMINENHFYPNHRFVVSDVLNDFRRFGYDHLALEVLAFLQDSILNAQNAYPTLKTGFYTNEQHFANHIRKAKALGYNFVAYENSDSNKGREVEQAECLYNKTFAKYPDAKVLVLAGIDHIFEKPTERGEEWLGYVFKTTFDVDTLTISQTHLNLNIFLKVIDRI